MSPAVWSALIWVLISSSVSSKRLSCHCSQEVCPWNSPKLVQATSERDYLPRVPGLSGSRPDPESGTETHPHL
jgi:hypothetical protein